MIKLYRPQKYQFSETVPSKDMATRPCCWIFFTRTISLQYKFVIWLLFVFGFKLADIFEYKNTRFWLPFSLIIDFFLYIIYKAGHTGYPIRQYIRKVDTLCHDPYGASTPHCKEEAELKLWELQPPRFKLYGIIYEKNWNYMFESWVQRSSGGSELACCFCMAGQARVRISAQHPMEGFPPLSLQLWRLVEMDLRECYEWINVPYVL